MNKIKWCCMILIAVCLAGIIEYQATVDPIKPIIQEASADGILKKNKDDPNIKIAYLPDGTRCAIWLANGIGAGGISCDWR
jgi:hypothetical protein